jgi:hypothetical protein
MVRRALLFLSLTFAFAAAAQAQPTLAVTPTAGPGDTVTADVSGATPNSGVAILASLRSDGITFGPVDTRCGTIQVDLSIGPGLRLVGRGRAAADGTFSTSVTFPPRLHPRLDGVVIHSQAINAVFVADPATRTCSVTTSVSNVADTTIHVP